MPGKSEASKEEASSANPLSDLSSGASSTILADDNDSNNNDTNTNTNAEPTPAELSSAISVKSPIEPKAQKASFLSLIFCCGANFVNDSDTLQVVSPPNHPVTESVGKARGKKPVARNSVDEKYIPDHTTTVEITAIAGQEGEHSHSQEIESTGLLGPIAPEHKGRKCLVLDLDETLVHSSIKPNPQADYVVPVEIDNQSHNFYVLKRPGVETFLQKMGELYEVVIFTASLSKYADPAIDILDTHRVVKHRLFRESCFNHKGNYIKDLSVLGRDLKNTIIIDNSPACYTLHPTNAIPISSWFNDPHDTELLDLIPFLADMTVVDDVNPILDMTNDEEP
ncbi:hypothetical protein BGZ49_007147 [Haplosporangium sp. Z 27]|nr:hypothetical protein BGZ49_007147 [Haplosporangium sp. Z 27]